MQAVFDSEVFQIAQPGIDATQCIVGPSRPPPQAGEVGRDARLACEPGALRRLDDQAREALAAAAIEAVGLRIFVDQALKLAGVAGETGAGKRRRQMPDGHRRDAALGLRGLARIADDERIDHRQRPGDDFRKAVRRERHRLAG